MTFRELYALNVGWDSGTILIVVAGANEQNNRLPNGVKRQIRGEAHNLLQIFGDAHVVAFGGQAVVLSYEDYVFTLGGQK